MATDRSIDASAAILVPDPRIVWSSFQASASTYTGTAPIPGQPDPNGTYQVSLTARGAQAAADTLAVITQQGGQIGRESGATFIWALNNGTRHGWDAPTVITDFEAVTWATTPAATNPHAIVTDADDLLVVWERGSFANSVYTSTRSTTTGAWSAEAQIDLEATPLNGCTPCLLRLDDGRLLLFAWIENGTDEGQIRMLFSDDDGATWEVGAGAVLPAVLNTGSTSSGFITNRLRAAQIDGQILLLVWLRSRNTTPANADELRQYASCDDGHSFTLVYQSDRTTAGQAAAYPDVVVANGEFVVARLGVTNRLPLVSRLPSAYLPLSSVDAVEAATSEAWGTLDGTGKYFQDGDCWISADETGVLYLSGRTPSAGNRWPIVSSTDGGTTWAAMARSALTSGGGTWFDSEDSATYLRQGAACWHHGRAVVVSTFTAAPGTYDGGSIVATYLGGYSTATMPSYDYWRTDGRQVTWGETWLPLDLPADTGWTRTVAGLASDAISSGARLSLSVPTAPSSIIYHRVPGGSVAHGVTAAWCVAPGSAGTPTVTLQTADGTEGYSLRITLTAAGVLTATDVIGASTVATVSSVVGEVAVLASITAGVCSVWYRQVEPEYSARTWIRLVDSVALTDDGAATITANRIAWGHTSGGVSQGSQWRYLCWIDDEGSATNYAGQGLGAADFPADLLGRRFSASGVGVGRNSTTIVTATGGPVWQGQRWTITPADTYGIERVHAEVSPSPREGARLSGAGTTTLIWEMAEYNGWLSSGRSLAVALLGINFPTATLYGRSHTSGTWTSLATVSAAWMSSASWTRYGESLLITSGSPARYVSHGQLTGFYVDLGSGKIRRVAGNTEGQTGATGSVEAILRLEGIDGTEGNSGTCTLYAPSVVCVVPEPAARYYQWKIEIPATTTAEGYLLLGKVLIGAIYWLARRPSPGRSVEVAPQIEVAEQPGGVSRVRRIGPPIRQVRLPLDEQMASSQIWQDSPSPDYQILATGASPVAARHAAPTSLAGLVAELNGAPVVFFNRFKKAANTTSGVSYTDPAAMVYGRFTDPITLTVNRGNEGQNGVYTASGLLLREIP